MRLHRLARAYPMHEQRSALQPRKHVRHVDISLAGLALNPFCMRVNVQDHGIVLILWWKRRLDGCALLELRHLWHILASYGALRLQPRKQVRQLAVYSVGSAFDPFYMRGYAQEHIIIVVHLGKCGLDQCALLEIWHLQRIFSSLVRCAKTALTLPLELCFGRILPFWKAESMGDAYSASLEGDFKK